MFKFKLIIFAMLLLFAQRTFGLWGEFKQNYFFYFDLFSMQGKSKIFAVALLYNQAINVK